jgi:hypothetical protein
LAHASQENQLTQNYCDKVGNLKDKEADKMLIMCMEENPCDHTMNVIYEFPAGMLVSNELLNKLFNEGASDQFMLVADLEGIGSKCHVSIAQSYFSCFLT